MVLPQYITPTVLYSRCVIYLNCNALTCVIRMVVSLSHAHQAAHAGLYLVYLSRWMMAQLCPGVRVTLPGLHVFSPPGLILIIGMISLMLDPQPLSFFDEWSLLDFRQQAAKNLSFLFIYFSESS